MFAVFLLIVAILLLGFTAVLVLVGFTYAVYDFRYRAWVETKNRVVGQMVESAALKSNDKVYDLGCGDGRILIEAAKREKIRGVGYEINPIVVFMARLRVWANHLQNTISIQRKDFFKEDMRDADVVFLYLFPEMLTRLEPKLKQELRSGTRIISNSFPLKSFQFVKAHPENERVRMYIV